MITYIYYFLSTVALTYVHKKSADLPYIHSGLPQPLISYGEVCAKMRTLQWILGLLLKIPCDVVVRVDN